MTQLNDGEVQTIVSEILSQKLAGLGFIRAETKPDVDFDGAPIIRVQVYFDRPVSMHKPLLESTHAIRERLLGRGDDRYVFLSPDDESGASDRDGEDYGDA
jgi:hypothetical protein